MPLDFATSFPDFLGYGLTVPFQRGSNDFVAAGGVEFIQSSICLVLGTRAGSDYTEGELPWDTDFGSLLHFLRHKNNTIANRELARVYVVQAISRYIPQILIKDVQIEAEPSDSIEKNIMSIRLLYDIRGEQQAGNAVLISNVSQVVELAA